MASSKAISAPSNPVFQAHDSPIQGNSDAFKGVVLTTRPIVGEPTRSRVLILKHINSTTRRDMGRGASLRYYYWTQQYGGKPPQQNYKEGVPPPQYQRKRWYNGWFYDGSRNQWVYLYPPKITNQPPTVKPPPPPWPGFPDRPPIPPHALVQYFCKNSDWCFVTLLISGIDSGRSWSFCAQRRRVGPCKRRIWCG